MISVQYHFPAPLDLEPLERAIQLSLQHQSAPDNAELTVVLADDQTLHELNLDYRDVDAPTDVLSFPANQPDPETGALYLGDILISVDRAQEQANTGGHPLQAELQLLIVHGLLHLLGHDHAEPDEKEQMWSAQAEILARLGLSRIRISE